MDTAVVVKFEGSGAAGLQRLAREAWARCVSAPHDSPDSRIRVVVDDDQMVISAAVLAGVTLAGSDPRALMDRLSPTVTVAAIEHQAGHALMLHAAGLSSRSGRTVVMVAPAGTGKTTAARVLGRHLGYVTDETLAIRADGTIAPYPKPLSVMEPGSPYKSQVSPDEAQLAVAPQACVPVGLVVLDRDGSVEPWLEPISVVRALALLAPETSYLSRLPQPLHTLARVVQSCGGLRVLHYAEADTLPPLVAAITGES